MGKTSRLIVAAFLSLLCSTALAQPFWVSLAKAETQKYEWPSCKVAAAIILVESSGNKWAQNGAAKGLMQVLNAPFDPKKNIELGVQILNEYYHILGSKVQAVKAYNVGLGNFQRGVFHAAEDRYYNKVVGNLDIGAALCSRS